MTFNNIKGHKAQIDFLSGSFCNNRISQAYLFVGKEGIGKSLIAKEFAKLLNCENPVGGACCDKCISCSKIKQGLHPDIFYLKSADAESIKIEQCRELKWFFSLAPYEAKYKIAIIDTADSLTSEASNSLLKILEEPNRNAVLILISTSEDKLLPTVISRCQTIKFKSLSKDMIYSILSNEYNLDSETSRVYVNYANGSLGLALRLKETDFMSLRKNIISNFLLRNRTEAIGKELSSTSNSQDLKRIMFILMTLFRDSAVLKVIPGKVEITNADYEREIKNFYKNISAQQVISTLDRLIEIYELVDRSVNKRLIVAGVLSYLNLSHS